MRILTCCSFALMLLASAADAQFYSRADLDRVRKRSAPKIELMVTQDLVKTLPRELRARGSEIRVHFPDRGDHPLAFWSIPSQRTIHVPLESVRYFNDLAILFAWFERHKCRGEYIQTYLHGFLRKGEPLGPPLAAFGIDRDAALRDHFVDDVSGKSLKSGIMFIMGHEMGHVLLNHRGGLTGAASQLQEKEADSFSLDRFAQIGAPAAGALFYFMAVRWTDYVGDATRKSSHPVSSTRIAAIAQRLAERPRDFSFAEPNVERGKQQVMSIARDMAGIAEILSDDGTLSTLPYGLERDFPTSRLRSACPGGR